MATERKSKTSIQWIAIAAIVALVIGAVGGYFYGNQVGYNAGLEAGAPKTIKVGWPGGLGFDHSPTIVAMEKFAASYGIVVERKYYGGSALMSKAIETGDIDVAQGASLLTVSRLDIAGSNVTLIMSDKGNGWSFVAKAGINALTDLEGKKFGILDKASYPYYFAVPLFANAGVDINKVEMIAAGDSGTRLKALLAGQLDATGLETNDVITLLKEGGTDFSVLTSIATALPSWIGGAAYVKKSSLNDPTKRELILKYVEAYIESCRWIWNDVDRFKTYIPPFFPQLDKSILNQTIDMYKSLKFWPQNGGVTMDLLTANAKLIWDQQLITQDIQGNMTYYVDLSILNQALTDLGTVSGWP